MPLTTIAKNAALDTVGVASASLHTADPTEAGTVGELAGTGYARQAMTFNAAVSGSAAMSQASVTFTVPAGNTISHYALWNGSGQCVATGALPSAEAYADAGSYRITDFTLALNGCP